MPVRRSRAGTRHLAKKLRHLRLVGRAHRHVERDVYETMVRHYDGIIVDVEKSDLSGMNLLDIILVREFNRRAPSRQRDECTPFF
jgi:hypothetical protein